ncbi:MAG: hypothetical protein ABI880_03020 [Acidobacteriota bacterium]
MANDDTIKNHPVGETVGTAGGAVAGMAVGAAVGGPIGAVVGAAVGAVTGGVAGHGVAAAFNPTVEDQYWQSNYASRPYVKSGAPYADYQDAYRYGGQSFGSYPDFDTAAPNLERNWDKAKMNSRLGWHEAKDAVRDGWNRVEKAIPGDSDGDGR